MAFSRRNPYYTVVVRKMTTKQATLNTGAHAMIRARIFSYAAFTMIVLITLSVNLNCISQFKSNNTPDFEPSSWTLVVLPDTQFYSQGNPGNFYLQTEWVCENSQELNIKYVLHLGDITNKNNPEQWGIARNAFGSLDGCVPYAVVTGNHDHGPGGNSSQRNSMFNDYFDYNEMAAWPTFGGSMAPGNLENTYHLFEANGAKWIIIAAEWAPRNETLDWANTVMSEHPDRMGIFITHAYMEHDDERMDHASAPNPNNYEIYSYTLPGTRNDGEEIWQKLVKRHDFRLVISGHVCVDGTGYLASQNDQGHTVHQFLTNFQMREQGGQAYLRLFEFHPDGVTVQAKTYSPSFDSYLTAPDQQFRFTLE